MLYKILALIFVLIGFKLFDSFNTLALVFMALAFLTLFIGGDRAKDTFFSDYFEDDDLDF